MADLGGAPTDERKEERAQLASPGRVCRRKGKVIVRGPASSERLRCDEKDRRLQWMQGC